MSGGRTRRHARGAARVARGLALLAALLAPAAACGRGGGDEPRRLTRLEVGQPAPAYESLTLAGDGTSLASLRGDVVLLNIWATWCHPCRTEMPELERLYQAHAGRGLQVVGVSVDAGGEDEAVRAFVREHGLGFPIWRDPDGRVSTVFAAIGVPATYLVDRQGVLRWRKLGPIAERDPELARALEAALAGGR